MKPILCLDFDGVIHWYRKGWHGADVIDDEPVPGAVEFVKAAQEFFEVVVFSSRSHQNGGVRAMRTWMQQHGFDVSSISFPLEKPSAFLSIDDRVLLFEGEFPEPAALLAFKPWNKRERP